MRVKKFLGHLIFLIPGFLSAGTFISGHAPELMGKSMRLYSYTDFVTNNLILLDESIVDQNGIFSLEFSSDDILYVKLSCDNIAAHIYSQPNSKYDIEFPLPPTDVLRTFAKEARTEIVFNNLDESDINADIIDFNYNYDIFFKKNYETLRKLFSPKNLSSQSDSSIEVNRSRSTAMRLFTQLDDFSLTMDSIYKGSDSEFFKLYRNAVIADLRMNSTASPREIFEAHINSYKFYLNHPEFTKLLQRFFKFYFVKNTPSFGEQSLDSALNVNGSCEDLMEIMEKDDFLKDRELKEVVACMAIQEIWNGRVNRQNLAKILTDIAYTGISEESKKLATEVLSSLTNNAKGFPLVDFEFEDQFNQRLSVSRLKGRPCLIEFSADWCSACQQEEAALDFLIKEYYKDIQFLRINLFPEQRSAKKDGSQDVILCSISQHSPIIKDMKIAKLPNYIIIDDDGIVLFDKTPMPSSGLKAVLENLKLKNKEEQSKTIGRKEN